MTTRPTGLSAPGHLVFDLPSNTHARRAQQRARPHERGKMKLSIKGGVIAAVAAAAVAVPLAGAASASAATVPGAVHAVTHSAQHLDTTSGPVIGALRPSDNGPVWAYDNLSEQFTVVPDGGSNYKVSIDVTGSFQGFADPGANGQSVNSLGNPIGNYSQPLDSSGPVHGTISYEIQSSQAPDAKNLPAQELPGTGLGVAIGQLFGEADGLSIFNPAHVGPAQYVSGGSDYVFSYQNGNYVQDGTGIHGDVTGH
jgi:hypothetical protein